MAQGAARIVVARAPMLFHTDPRKLVILGMALIVPGAVYQLNDIVDLAIRSSAEQLGLRSIPQIFRAASQADQQLRAAAAERA